MVQICGGSHRSSPTPPHNSGRLGDSPAHRRPAGQPIQALLESLGRGVFPAERDRRGDGGEGARNRAAAGADENSWINPAAIG